MQITERDLALFRWINGFGFVFAGQIADWMQVSYRTAHDRVYKLKEQGYLRFEQKFFGCPHLLFLTRKSWEISGEALPLMKQFRRFDSFNHHAKLVDLSLELTAQYKHSSFIPERWLIYDRTSATTGPLTDGEFYLDDDSRPVAIELELSQKKAARLEKILNAYRRSFRYSAVWYFCAPDITAKLQEHVGSDPLFKVEEIVYTPRL